MAKISRYFLNLFGTSGPSSSFGQFGSKTAGSQLNTKDPATIQALAAYLNGWQSAVNATDETPYLEEVNALDYLKFLTHCYVFQEGVPEWDASTTYFVGSIVKKTGTSEFYKSAADNNVGNALPSKADNANWNYVIQRGLLQYDATYSYSINELVQKPGTAEIYQSLTSGNVGNALPSQTTTAIWAYLCNLANLTPSSGVSSIKFGFLPVSLTTAATASTSSSKIPTIDFGFDPAMTVYAFVVVTRTDFNINAASPSAFSFTSQQEAALSGTGVDASGKYLLGGGPANSYTLTLTTTISTSIGTGSNVFKATAIFIGIK